MPESVPLPLKGTVVNQSQLERQVADIAKKAGRNLKINLGTNAKDIKSLEQPLGRITGKADEFGKSMEAANARVIAFGASVGIINAVVQSFKSLVSTTIEVEANLAKINSILKTTTSGLDTLKGQIFDIARNTEQTFDTVAEAALELSRQGLSATEVTKRLNDALILSRLSGISAAEAVAGLTAAVNSFTKAGLTTGEVLNKISNAANQFAVSERDLIEGFKRSASVAEQAGVSIDELGGIITAVQQKTARGGAVIGNSFKTIFTRIGRAENLELLKSIGVEIQDLQGNILPATKLIENLGKQLENLDDIQVRSITEKIGGGFQIAPLLAALSDYSSETSIAIRATEAFRSATDQAYQKNIILNQTLSAAINSTSLTIKELANSLGELGVLDPFKEILNIVNNLAKGIKELLPSKGEDTGSEFAKGIIKGLSNALIKGGLAVFGLLLFELSKNLLKFGVDSFKTFLGLNKEAEKLKNIQAQIIQTLIGDKGVREQILAIERQSLTEEQKRAKQAEFFNSALRERVALTSQLNKISVGVAGAIRPAQATRRSAGGYLPVGAEQSDISRGVGGAPSSAKPVVIPNFAFGRGKKGTMVANTSEYIVPNFAGGGDAIFNQDMVKSMGLPSGAKKINAAGGYIPNFAKTTADQANFNEWMKSKYPKAVVKGRWSEQAFASNYGRLFRGSNPLLGSSAQGSLRRLYLNSPFKTKWDSYDTGKKQSLAIQASQKKAFGQKGGVTQYGVLFPDALGKSKSTNISVGQGYSVRAIPISTDPPNALYKEIREDLVKSAVDYASNIGLRPDSVLKDEKFKSRINESLNEGSVRSAFGSVFESAFQASLGRPIGKSNEVWDLDEKRVAGSKSGKTGEITDLVNSFNAEGLLAKQVSPQIRDLVAADFKNTLSEGNIKSLQQKILKTQTASKGYIPNYAMSPLEDAVQREKEAGVPVNQIRINQDGKLRNSQNPDGLAVTNTRDEPTGRIPRNAAAGFIPNYNRPRLSQSLDESTVAANTAASAKRVSIALDEAAKSAGDSADITAKEAAAREKSSNRMIALTGVAFGLQQIFGGLNTEADGLAGKMASVGEGITGAFFTASVAESFGAGPSSLGTRTFAKGKDPAGLAVEKFLKPLGKFGSGIGRTVGLFSRLVPVVGTAVTAFSLLNPILKKFFDFDLGGEIGKLTKGLFEALDIIDTPAEKAAKALDNLQKKINDDLLDLDFEGASRGVDNFIATLQEEASGVKDKAITEGKFDPAKFRQREFLNQPQFGVTRQRFLSGPEGKSTFGFSLDKDILEGKLFNEKRNITDEEQIKTFKTRIETQSLNFLAVTLANVSDELAQQLKSTSESRDIEGFRAALKKAKEDSLKNLTEDQLKLLDELEKEATGIQFLRTRGLAQDSTGNVVQAGDDSDLGKGQAKRLAEILKEYKAIFNVTEDVLDVNTKIVTINKKQLELQIQTRKNITEIIAATKSRLEFEKSTEASLIGTSKARKFQLEEELRAVENIRKQRIESARAVEKELSSNSKIANLLKATSGVGSTDERVRAAAAEKYRDIVEKTGEQIRLNGEYDKEALQTSIEKIFTLNKQGELNRSQKETIENIVNATTQQYEATKLILTAQQAQQALYDIEAKRKAEILRLDQQRFDVEQNRLKLQAKQDIAAKQAAKARIQERQERLGIIFGGPPKSSALDILNRSAQRQQEALDAGIQRRGAVEDVRQRFTETARQEGILGNVTVKNLLKELTNGDISQGRVKEIGLQLNEIAQLSREQLASDIDKQAAVLKDALEGVDIKGSSQIFDTSVQDFRDAVREFKGLEPLEREEQPLVDIQQAQQGGLPFQGPVPPPPPGGGLLPPLPGAGGSNNINFAGQFGYPPLNPQTGLPDRTKSGDALDVFNAGAAEEELNTSAVKKSIDEVNRYKLEQEALVFQRQLELLGAKTTEEKVAIDIQYRKYQEILKINQQIVDLTKELREAQNSENTTEEESITEQIKLLEKKKAVIDATGASFRDQVASLGITGQEAAEEMQTTFIQSADRFIDTISDGLVEAISKGEDLGDVLRGAAEDFLKTMAKQALNNVIRQSIGLLIPAPAPGMAKGGMVTGGSGMKDDVPAVLMGGEYVMKKSAVQKYGPNFMDQLNNGNIPGYAEGGIVEKSRNAINEYRSYRMNEDDMVRDQSEVLFSNWKQKSADDLETKNNEAGDFGTVLQFADGGIVKAFRTNSGVIASQWTPRSDRDDIPDEEITPKRKIRTNSGTAASMWTALSGLDKAKDSEFDDGKTRRTGSGLQSSDWTPKADLPNVLRFAQGGMVGPINEYKSYRMSQDEEARTRSGVLASDWTPKSDKDDVDQEDLMPERDIRTKTGIIASAWTKLANFAKAKDSEFDDESKKRTSSGIQPSDWTPKADLPNVLKFAEGGMVKSFRTKSGVLASQWTPRSDQDDVDVKDKTPDRKLRTKSGTAASLWTALSSLDKAKDSEFDDESKKRTSSGIQPSDWTPKADLPNVLKFANGGVISGGSGMRDDVPALLMGGEYVMKKSAVQKYGPNFMDQLNNGKLPGYAEGGIVSDKKRTESGIISSNWTREADEGKVSESSKVPDRNVRTESGLLASNWTRLANYTKAQKTELTPNLSERNESGLPSSRWTPKADKSAEIDVATGRSRYAPSAIRSEEKEERTESGIKPSRWIKEADYTKVNNVERATKEKYRAESGLEVSRWTKEARFDKAVDKKDSADALFRANSGLITSDWTREASIDKASGNLAKTSLQQTIDDRIKEYTERSIPKNIKVDQNNNTQYTDKTSNLNKGEVPSMLTGGEYVIGKKAAEKFGKGFLDSLNEGKVQNFAKGGLVSGATFAQDEKDFVTTDIFGSKIPEGSLMRQKGGGDFVIPGLYGQGEIIGGQNMLDFATQAFTSGSRDVVGGLQGASVIALEPESVRLTSFGRTRETPLQQATREAKGQAFGLNLEYQQQLADYKKLLEELKKQEKERKKAILTQAAIAIGGMALSAGLSGLGAAMGNGGIGSGAGQTSFGQAFLRGAPGASGSGTNIGGVLNFSSYSSGFRLPSFNLGGDERRYATGGYVTGGGSSDIDSVLAMLSGGEFVLNRAATEKIGTENLQNLNAGGDAIDSEKIVDKLEEILVATRENAGEINITVNDSGGGAPAGRQGGTQSAGNTAVERKGQSGDPKAREELANMIKLKVLEVLREEKRLGGTLRNG